MMDDRAKLIYALRSKIASLEISIAEEDLFWAEREQYLCDLIKAVPAWIRWFFAGGAH